MPETKTTETEAAKNKTVDITDKLAKLYTDKYGKARHLTVGGVDLGAVSCRKMLTADETAEMVQAIVDATIDPDTGDFRPERGWTAVGVYMLVYFTNATVSLTQETATVLGRYRKDIADFILGDIGEDALADIYESIADKVRYAKNVAAATQMSKVNEFVTACEEQMTTQTANMSALMERIKEVPEGDVKMLLSLVRDNTEGK